MAWQGMGFRGSGRKKKKKGKGHSQEELARLLQQQEPWMPELPPHLQRYKLNLKHDVSSAHGLLGIEDDEGRIEYKLKLLEPTPSRFHQLVTQLKWRLSEGGGECFYFIGVEDNGHPRGLPPQELQQSLAVLDAMAGEVGAAASLLRRPEVEGGRQCAVVAVRQGCRKAVDYVDLRVAVMGGVDAGKSTLVAVLTHGSGGMPLLDNGRGSARTAVARHKHEIESGHTSSVSQQALGYSAQGRVVNYGGVAGGVGGYTPFDVARSAARVIRFVDTGGHEKYSKTALHGLSCMLPDYAMLCVCAVSGVSWVSREHLAVALALGVPTFVVLTKVDLVAGEEQLSDSLVDDIRSLVSAAAGPDAAAAAPMALVPLVESEAEARHLATSMLHSRIGAGQLLVALFKVSCVTGSGLGPLHAFLHALRPEVDGLGGALRPEADAAAGANGSDSPGMAAAEQLAARAGSVPADLRRDAAAAPGLCSVGGSSSGGDGSAVVGLAARLEQGLALAQGSQAGSSAPVSLPQPMQGWYPTCWQPSAYQSAPNSASTGNGRGDSEGVAATATAAPSSSSSHPMVFQVDASFCVAGVGPVYSGRVVSGTLTVGSQLLLGPCPQALLGRGLAPSPCWGFQRASVVGLHRSQMPVECVHQGQIATVAVRLEQGEAPGESLGAAGGEGEEVEGGRPDSSRPAVGASRAAGPAAAPAADAYTGAPLGSQLGLGLNADVPGCGPAAACGLATPSPEATALAEAPAPRPSAAGCSVRGAGSSPHLVGTCWDLSEHLDGPSARGLVEGPGAAGSQRPPCPKASVLLSPALLPEPCWEFEAELVLLGGLWPPRGLMSGRWPPEPEVGDPYCVAQCRPGSKGLEAGEGVPADCSQAGAPTGSRTLHRRGSSKRPPSPAVYSAVIHCGSIHQAAQVVCMHELAPAGDTRVQGSCSTLTGAADSHLPLSADAKAILPALAAARLLQAEGWVPSLVGRAEGSWGSLHRMGSGRSTMGGSLKDSKARQDAPPLSASCPSGLYGFSPRATSGASLAGLSSTWSGESSALSSASSEGVGPGYESSASDVGLVAEGSRGRGRVGWADGYREKLQEAQLGGSPPGGQPPLHQEQQQSPAGQAVARHPSLAAARHDPDLGCLARVCFRFVKRPEWVVPGARVVVRDRGGGRAAAVGYVQSVRPRGQQ
ncbi:hypothetical protein N2152v2_006272 [Parachlorella kessleri]